MAARPAQGAARRRAGSRGLIIRSTVPVVPVVLTDAVPSPARVAVPLTRPPMLLSTDVWVAALIRRAELDGGFAVIARKGDPRAGAVLVRVLNLSDGTTRL